jgi:predicted TPR repeat methyltransferase
MPEITWMSPFLDIVLSYVPLHVVSVVDVGAGRGVVGALMRIYREPARLVAVEHFDEYIAFMRKHGFYDEIVSHDLRQRPLPFGEKEFDLAVALEVIEHLPKDDGLALLDEMVRISKQSIVSTPNEYYDQPEYDANPLQRHVSIYRASDLRKKGFGVIGVGNLSFLGLGKRFPHLSWRLRGFAFNLPRLSSHLLAVHPSESTGKSEARSGHSSNPV